MGCDHWRAAFYLETHERKPIKPVQMTPIIYSKSFLFIPKKVDSSRIVLAHSIAQSFQHLLSNIFLVFSLHTVSEIYSNTQIGLNLLKPKLNLQMHNGKPGYQSQCCFYLAACTALNWIPWLSLEAFYNDKNQNSGPLQHKG